MRQNSTEQISNYLDIRESIDYVVGTVEIFLLLMPLMSMILALARKTWLPKLQWVLLSGLFLSELGMVTVAF